MMTYRIIFGPSSIKETNITRFRTALNGWVNVLDDIHVVRGNSVCSGKALEMLFWETTGRESGDKEEKEIVSDMEGFLDVAANGAGLSDFQKRHHEKYRLRDITIVALILDTGINKVQHTLLVWEVLV